MPKPKLTPTDGLGPLEIKKLRSAIRLVWQRSHARRVCVNRCTRESGYAYCELCGEMTPKLKVDHIVPVSDVDPEFIKRMFCPSTGLQGLCKTCHNAKTRAERRVNRIRRASGS